MSSDSDGLIKLWTVKTSECLKTFDEHTEKVHFYQFYSTLYFRTILKGIGNCHSWYFPAKVCLWCCAVQDEMLGENPQIFETFFSRFIELTQPH